MKKVASSASTDPFRNRVTHAEFMKMSEAHGLSVVKIGQRYVYLKPPVYKVSAIDDGLVDFSWKDHTLMGLDRTLEDAVRTDRRIVAIKIIRANTGVGLKRAKDFVWSHWDRWRFKFSG